MKRATEQALIAAFDSPDTCEAVAKVHGITPREVRRFWSRARDGVRLPLDAVRKFFVRQSSTPLDDEVVDDPVDASTRLLDALVAEHGGDPKFLHVMPAEFLDGEMPRNTFDQELHFAFAGRILSRLKFYFRSRDLLMRALLNKRSARLAHGR